MFLADQMFPRYSLFGSKDLRFFGPFTILIFRDAGLGFTLFRSLYAIRDIASNILEIPTRIFADIFSHRRETLGVFRAYVISFHIFNAFKNFYLSTVAMIHFAFGGAIRVGTHKVMILEHPRLFNIEHLRIEHSDTRNLVNFKPSFKNFGQATNITFINGALLFWITGTTAWRQAAGFSIGIFLFVYFMNNVQLPMNSSVICDQISHEAMASCHSVGSQLTIFVAAFFAPLLSFLSNNFKGGSAILTLSSFILLLFIIVRVTEDNKKRSNLVEK